MQERKAAEDLIGQGADVLAQNTDSPGPLLVARDKKGYAFGWNSDMSHYAPKSHLTANVQNWSVYYIKEVGDALAGKWKAEATAWGLTGKYPVDSAITHWPSADCMNEMNL